MNVIVCGSRTFRDQLLLDRTLTTLHASEPVTLLIHGAARGADLYGAAWAFRNKIDVRPYLAEWQLYGRAAGPIRNQRMLMESRPDLVVAFIDKPLPYSHGTFDMVARSRHMAVPVTVVRSP